MLLWVSWAISAVSAAALCALAYRLRGLRLRSNLLSRREADAMEDVRAFCAASRTSVRALLDVLSERVRARDPNVDVLAVFVPDLDDMHCTFVCGIRGEHLLGLRIRRDDERRLPAQAAVRQRWAIAASGQALLPSDRCALAVPLHDDEALVAVAYAACARKDFGDARALASAIERCGLPYAIACERERDVAEATYDGLTGLLSPHAFRSRLHEEISSMDARGGDGAALLFVDTDDFKSINDTLGHRVGDAVLRQMAGILRARTTSDLDVTARNGGDEFCALLRNTQKTRAIERARALCAAVRSHDFGIGRAITASVGVAAYPLDATGSSDLLELADAAMYFSKRAGRDRASYALARDRFSACER